MRTNPLWGTKERKNMVFRVKRRCNPVGGYKLLGATYYRHLHFSTEGMKVSKFTAMRTAIFNNFIPSGLKNLQLTLLKGVQKPVQNCILSLLTISNLRFTKGNVLPFKYFNSIT